MVLNFSLKEVHAAARQFWNAAGDARVIAFHGQMGAGKTTFIHALCDEKGVRDTVGSPTFSIINEYAYTCEGTPRVLFHIDLYRLGSEQEAIQAGVSDCLESGYICLVEWPEKAPGLFDEYTLHVYLSTTDDQNRQLRIGNN